MTMQKRTEEKGATRREFMSLLGAGAAACTIRPASAADVSSARRPRIAGETPATERMAIVVDPQPQYELSPYLYMQFMEPLGTTDGSVAAAWDFRRDCWREDVIEVTKELAPTLIRWGGCFVSYYRWKEGVGPRPQRTPMLNLLWGGVETNQVGTHEFVDFCHRVGSDPLLGVNFESDGRKRWQRDPKGSVRSAGPEEAAEWVRYCNAADSALRREHGRREPYNVRLWQIGNETSYDRNGFDCETAARRTVDFARAMRKEDPDIQIIGWGDSGWAPRMIEIAGEQLRYIGGEPGSHLELGIIDHGLEWRVRAGRWSWLGIRRYAWTPSENRCEQRPSRSRNPS